jgi:hypothetical protein
MVWSRKRWLRVGAMLLAAPLLASPVGAAPGDVAIDRPLVRSGWGVSIHALEDPDADYAHMAAAGIRVVRMDLNWARTEPARGQYDWSYADALVTKAAAHNLRPLLILAYSNPVYDGPSAAPRGIRMQAAPARPDTDAAFARWAAAAAQHFRSAQPILEIWNEPNQDRFWQPGSSADGYAGLAADTCQAIRAAAPDTMILAPALSNTPPLLPASPFLDRFARSPAARCVSAISIHPYLFMGAIDGGVNWWRGVSSHLAGLGLTKPLANSESGLSTYSGRLSDVDQASYLVRMFVQDAAAGLPVSIWYDWQDDGTNPNEPEHHFGLKNHDGQPKPAYSALKTLTSAIGGAARICYLQQGGERRAFFHGGSAQDVLVVAWDSAFRGRSVAADQQPLQIDLPLGAKVERATDMLGGVVSPSPAGPSLRVAQGRAPFLVRYRGALPPACAKAA